MATLTVGSGKGFSTIAAAIAATRDGDVVAVDAGTYVNDFATIKTKITLQGVGGMVQMVATVAPPNGKAILVTSTDVTVDHFEFSGTRVAAGNGAGIRYEAGNLTVTNSYFHHNQNGLLAATNPAGSITVRNSEFSHNGTGDSLTHNLYANQVGTLTIDNSYFHDAVAGHEIKSRANSTVITNSRIVDGPTGTANYSIDLPNGGRAILSDNVIEQGPRSGNPVILAFGEEGNLRANTSLQMTGNTILNDLSSPSVKLLWNATAATATLSDNSVYGLSTAQYGSGPMTVTGMTALATEPALDTSHPWATATTPSGTGTTSLMGTASDDAVTLSQATQNLTVDLLGGSDRLTLSSAGPNTVKVSNTETIIGGGATDAVTLATTLASGTVDLGGGTDRLTLSSAGPNTVKVSNSETIIGGSYGDAVTLGTALASGTVQLGGGSDRLTLSSSGSNAVQVNSVETAVGGTGDDRITNTGTAARLEGGAGSDTIVGGAYNDELYGGAGKDVLTGGSGSDRFIWKAVADAPVGAGEAITDFNANGDLLVFGGLQRGTFEFRGASAFSVTGRSEARFVDSTDQLYVDTNGDGTADMQVTLTGVSLASLSKADFLWV